jgi:hypothetical protein
VLASPVTDQQDRRACLRSPSLWAWLLASAAAPWHGCLAILSLPPAPRSVSVPGCLSRARVMSAQLGSLRPALTMPQFPQEEPIPACQGKKKPRNKWALVPGEELLERMLSPGQGSMEPLGFPATLGAGGPSPPPAHRETTAGEGERGSPAPPPPGAELPLLQGEGARGPIDVTHPHIPLCGLPSIRPSRQAARSSWSPPAQLPGSLNPLQVEEKKVHPCLLLRDPGG